MNLLMRIRLPWQMKPTPEQLEAITKLIGKPVIVDADGTLGWSAGEITATAEEAVKCSPTFEVIEVLPYVRVSEVQKVDVQPPVNERCNVVVAGNSVLLGVREVKIAPDYCTEALQRELDAGWRILAICVQPDQRRPDYVLGKIGGVQ